MSTIPEDDQTTETPLAKYAGELKTATGFVGESPSRNGLGTYLSLAVVVLTAIATGAAALAGDPDTAQLTGKLAVGMAAIAAVGKYAQAFAKILTLGRAILPAIEPQPTIQVKADITSDGQAGPVASEPPAAPPSQALVPPESAEYTAGSPAPEEDDDEVSDEDEFASPPPPAAEGTFDPEAPIDVDDVLPVSVPDLEEQPGVTERPESGVVPDAPAPHAIDTEAKP